MKPTLKLSIILLCTLNSFGMDPSYLRSKLQPQTPEAKQLYAKAQELIKTGSDLNASIENKCPLLAQAALSNEHTATTLLLLSV